MAYTPKTMVDFVSGLSWLRQAFGSTPAPVHSVAWLMSTRLILAQSVPARSKRADLGLARRQFVEVEHGQPVDDAGIVEQRDLEGGLGQFRPEIVGDHEGQPAALV